MTQARIVGFYFDVSHVRHGYVVGPDGKFVNFDAPGASTGGTSPISITPSGKAMGSYPDANFMFHGFVRKP